MQATILESPDLGDPKEVWTKWLDELRTKNRRDPTVQFAIKRAERVLGELEAFEKQKT